MTKAGSALAAALLGAIVGAGSPAMAQTPGRYAGHNSEGFSVNLVVYKNDAGKLFLTLVREAALFYCDGKPLLTRGQPLAYGAAVLMEAPIKNGAVTFAASSNDLSAVSGTASFSGNAVRGTLAGYAALYAGTATPPNDFEAKSCRTQTLHFTATYSNQLQ